MAKRRLLTTNIVFTLTRLFKYKIDKRYPLVYWRTTILEKIGRCDGQISRYYRENKIVNWSHSASSITNIISPIGLRPSKCIGGAWIQKYFIFWDNVGGGCWWKGKWLFQYADSRNTINNFNLVGDIGNLGMALIPNLTHGFIGRQHKIVFMNLWIMVDNVFCQSLCQGFVKQLKFWKRRITNLHRVFVTASKESC